MAEEYSDYVNIRGLEVRERRITFSEDDGSEHISIFVEDKHGDILFAPEFLSHTNNYAKVEVTVHLPGHDPEYYEIVDYDLTAHAMKGSVSPTSRGAGQLPRKSELERLIDEQASDAKYGHRVRSDAISLDVRLGTEASDGVPLSDFLDAGGTIHLKPLRPRFQCPYHGPSEYGVLSTGRHYCRACNRFRLEARRRAMGKGRRPKGPGCSHPAEQYTEVSGRIRCRECLRAADRRHYWRKKNA